MDKRWLLACVLALGCGRDGGFDATQNKAAGAAAAVGLGMAAAGVSRAGGGCWSQCTFGLVCDTESGTCIPEAQARARAQATGSREPLPSPKAGDPVADPCRGLCVTGETCQVKNGVADCVGVAVDSSPPLRNEPPGPLQPPDLTRGH
jgi:hypothetical protein